MLWYKVLRTRANGKENEDFKLVRPMGTDDYLFIHFKTPVVFTLFDEEFKIAPGNCILLTPGTPHSFYPENSELVHDWLHFLPSDDKEFSKLKIEKNTFFKPVDTSFITASVKKCESEIIYKDCHYESVVSSEVTKMLVKLERILREDKNIKQHNEEFKRLRYDIYQKPQEFFDTTDMAESVNLSRSRFSVVYKELFGISPKEDLINARVSKACYLLSIGTLSLKEISGMCGYQNIYHFIRQFRSQTGTTPGIYRKNL